MRDVSYKEARRSLARLLDRVTEGRDTVLIRRRGRERVVLVAADEFAGLLETAHLLRSPRNAARLLAALRHALTGRGRLIEAELRDPLIAFARGGKKVSRAIGPRA